MRTQLGWAGFDSAREGIVGGGKLHLLAFGPRIF
jgi:hypothetical protein